MSKRSYSDSNNQPLASTRLASRKKARKESSPTADVVTDIADAMSEEELQRQNLLLQQRLLKEQRIAIEKRDDAIAKLRDIVTKLVEEHVRLNAELLNKESELSSVKAQLNHTVSFNYEILEAYLELPADYDTGPTLQECREWADSVLNI